MRKYLLTTLFATLSALMVWMIVPKEYAAQTQIIDEFHETMLEVGIDRLEAMIKDKTNMANQGMNDIETYCKILKSRDFEQRIPGFSIDKVNYNVCIKQQSMKIEYVDSNPEVAAEMLRKILTELQNVISESNQKRDTALYQYYQQTYDSLRTELDVADAELISFSDSHIKISTKAEQTHKEELSKSVQTLRKQLRDAEEDCARQKMLMQRPYTSFAVLNEVTTPTDDNSHPIGYVLCFNIIALLAVKGWSLWRKNRATFFKTFDWGNIFAPWTLTICIWALILFLLAIDTVLDPLSEQFYVSLCLWLAIFLPASILSCNLLKPRQPKTETNIIEINQGWFNFFFAIAVIITPLYAYEVYKIIAMFDLQDPLKSVRQLAIFGDGHGFLDYAYVFDMALLIVGLWRYPKIPLWQILTIVAIWLIHAISLMAKWHFLILFVCLIYVLFQRKVIKLRTIILGCGIVLVLFYLFNILREGEEYQNNESFLDFVGMYVLSSSVAFGKAMRAVSEHFSGQVFWIFHYYGNKFFDMPEVPHMQMQEFVEVPIMTNVYTIFRPYFIDFGQIGVAMAALLYGVLSGAVYRYSRCGYSYAICLYTYLIYVLSMQFFDAVMELSGILIQFLLIMYLLVKPLPRLQIGRGLRLSKPQAIAQTSSKSENNSGYRTKLLIGNIAASFVIKGWSGVVQLLLVPLTIACLGKYVNGIWMVVVSVLLWIDNMDIGLANGLRNKLAESRSKGETEQARSYVSTTFVMLAIIMLVVIILTVCLMSVIDVYSLLNINRDFSLDVPTVLLVSLIVTSITFVFKITGNVYLALQLPAVNNMIVALGQTVTLLCVCALYLFEQKSLMYIALAYTLSPLLVNIIAFVYTFTIRYPELMPSFRLYSNRHLGGLLSLGVKFFLIQIASLVLFATSNIIISRLFSPEAVTPYQVAYRYYSLTLILFTLIATPFWSATTDAYSRGDFLWIKQARKKIRYVLAGIAVMLTVMVLASDFVIKIWIGGEVTVPLELSVFFAIYLFVIMYSQAYSFFLNGLGVLSLQLVMTILAAVIYIPVAIYFGKILGVAGICLALIVVNVPGALVNLWQFNRIIARH